MTEEQKTIQKLRNKIIKLESKNSILKAKLIKQEDQWQLLYHSMAMFRRESYNSKMPFDGAYKLFNECYDKLKKNKWESLHEKSQYLSGYNRYWHKTLDACLLDNKQELYEKVHKEFDTSLYTRLWQQVEEERRKPRSKRKLQ